MKNIFPFIRGKRIQIIIILFIGLAIFHKAFISSKTYESNYSYSVASNKYYNVFPFKITDASEEQYRNYLNAIRDGEEKQIFIGATKTSYFFGLPYSFVYLIFGGYFLLISAFVLLYKKKKANEN